MGYSVGACICFGVQLGFDPWDITEEGIAYLWEKTHKGACPFEMYSFGHKDDEYRGRVLSLKKACVKTYEDVEEFDPCDLKEPLEQQREELVMFALELYKARGTMMPLEVLQLDKLLDLRNY